MARSLSGALCSWPVLGPYGGAKSGIPLAFVKVAVFVRYGLTAGDPAYQDPDRRGRAFDTSVRGYTPTDDRGLGAWATGKLSPSLRQIRLQAASACVCVRVLCARASLGALRVGLVRAGGGSESLLES